MNSLYRKYRPNNFEAVFGQDHITKTLKNQIKENAIGHAYLFTGVRGTGKTSVAKIFARAINCESDENRPCNECDTCVSILKGRSTNVIEIDAASNNGVDNIRDIREEVKYSPSSGKYKVYIIDEVHMLSIGAFNAMLKTLEEPPKHVVFILATTDPAKIPSTIHSRVLRFDFKRIKTEVLASNIKEYAQKENINISEEALLYIASLGDGSARDTLSILEKIAAQEKDLDITKVKDILGNMDNSLIEALAFSIIGKDSKSIIEQIDHINSLGKDYSVLVIELIAYFRNSLLDAAVNNQKKASELIYCIEILMELLVTLKYEKYPRMFTEVYLIKIALRDLRYVPDEGETNKSETNKSEINKSKPKVPINKKPLTSEPPKSSLTWREALEQPKKEDKKEVTNNELSDTEKKDILSKINTNIDWR